MVCEKKKREKKREKKQRHHVLETVSIGV